MVRKHWLHCAAGLMWLGVGIMLNVIAARWLKAFALPIELELVVCGVLLAAPIYLFGFSRLARKNILRIATLEGERASLFAFQSWTSYPLVIFMVMLGIYLRVYSPLPKPLLAIIYMGIGGGLFGSSLHYFNVLRQSLRPTADSSDA